MKCLLILMVALALPPVANAKSSAKRTDGPDAWRENGSPVSLKNGAKIVFKINRQAIGKDCSATREWLEVTGRPDAKAQDLINRSIREELTVGKRLARKHCPGGDTRYINRATLTGSRSKLIGVETAVHFSGDRSGTHLKNCAFFNLETGARFDLGSHLTAAGKEQIAKQLCEEAKKRGESQERYCRSFEAIEASLYYGFRYCLLDRGVGVFFGPANLTEGETKLSEESLATAFQWPDGGQL